MSAVDKTTQACSHLSLPDPPLHASPARDLSQKRKMGHTDPFLHESSSSTLQAQASITIANTTHRNSKDDVARMVREAEQFAAADAALKKKADTRVGPSFRVRDCL